VISLAALGVALAALGFGLSLEALVRRLMVGAGGGRARSRPERLAVALLLGLGVGPALWTALVAVLGPPTDSTARWLLLAAGLAGLPTLPGLLRPRVAAPRPVPERWTATQGLLAALCLGFLAFAQVYAATLPMHLFDPLFHFAYKGKLIHTEGFGSESWMVLPPELEAHPSIGRIITHPNYPPGVPTLHAWVAHAGGRFDEDATRSLGGLWVLTSTALLWVLLRPRGRTPALFACASWCTLPLLYYSRLPHDYITWAVQEEQFVGSLEFRWLEAVRAWLALWTGGGERPDGWTLDGAADLPLAALVLAAVTCLWRRSPGSGLPSDRADALFGGLFLGSLVLCKNEGTALLALLLAVFGAAALARRLVPASAPAGVPRPLRELALATAAALLVASPWLVLRGAIPSIDEDYPRALLGLLGLGESPAGAGVTNRTPTEWAQVAERVPTVAGGFLTSLGHLLRWNLTWWLLLSAALWWLVRRPLALLRHPALPLLVAVGGAVLLYATTLLLTPWDLAALYTTTIPGRLLLHVAPVAILACTWLLWTTASERRGRPAGEGPP
jgi:hypothetical protein